MTNLLRLRSVKTPFNNWFLRYQNPKFQPGFTKKTNLANVSKVTSFDMKILIRNVTNRIRLRGLPNPYHNWFPRYENPESQPVIAKKTSVFNFIMQRLQYLPSVLNSPKLLNKIDIDHVSPTLPNSPFRKVTNVFPTSNTGYF